MATTGMGDRAIAVGRQEEHLSLPTIGIQWPAMAEHDGLSRAPVLVVDLRAVFRRHRAHCVCLRFCRRESSTSHVRLTIPTRRPVDSLFRRFAIEVLVVGLRVGARMVDDAVPMIRGRIECIAVSYTHLRAHETVL